MKKFLKLQWLLEFVQTDLNKLTKVEIEKLANELSNILSITGVSLFAKDEMLDDKLTKIALDEQANNIDLNRVINSLQEVKNNNVIPEVMESLPSVQSGVSQAFSNLIRSIQRQKAEDKNGSLPLWEEVGSLNTKVSVKCFLEGPGIAGTDLFIPSNHIQRINEASQMLHDKFGDNLCFQSKSFNERKIRWSHTVSDNLTDNVLFHFFHSLNDITVGAFCECPECNKWFVHTTKRKRKYCTNKCAAKSGGRNKRALAKMNKQLRETVFQIAVEPQTITKRISDGSKS